MSESIAHALLSIGAVGFTPDQPITFKSGIVSPVYVDNRRLPYHPAQWKIVIEAFSQQIQDSNITFDVVAGVAVGGVPHSSALGYALLRPSIFIRKAEKEHGKGQRIEGGTVTGKRVLLIEDLVTTGDSSLSAVRALREAGAECDTVLAIVQYGFEQAALNFAEANVTLKTLVDFKTILTVAQQSGMIDEQQQAIVREWFQNPQTWAGKYHT